MNQHLTGKPNLGEPQIWVYDAWERKVRWLYKHLVSVMMVSASGEYAVTGLPASEPALMGTDFGQKLYL
jgi:hypothetical protein